MCGGVGFGEVVGKVGVSSFPKYDELALLDAILNPVESHADGFGVALLESLFGNINSGSVVRFKGGGWLFVYQFWRELRMMVPSLALRNIPPTSDSVAEYMTFLMMVEMVWTAPLFGGGIL